MQFFGVNHLPGELFKRNRATLHMCQKLAVQRQGGSFRIQRFPQHGRYVVLVRVKQRAYGKRRVGAECGDPLANLLGVQQ